MGPQHTELMQSGSTTAESHPQHEQHNTHTHTVDAEWVQDCGHPPTAGAARHIDWAQEGGHQPIAGLGKSLSKNPRDRGLKRRFGGPNIWGGGVSDWLWGLQEGAKDNLVDRLGLAVPP